LEAGLVSKLISPETAAEWVQDGCTISTTGSGCLLEPDLVLEAIEKRFLSTGHPQGLTHFYPIYAGTANGRGTDRLAHAGLIRRVITSSFSLYARRMTERVLAGEVEAYNLPLGAIFEMYRAQASGKPRVITPVGLHTFVDPRKQGGRCNAATTEELVRLISVEGEEFLSFPALPVDVTIIRATTADEYGNLTFEEEPSTFGSLWQAMAAHNSGGRVIAQVRRLARRGSLPPHLVRVPGMLVDGVVVDPDQEQLSGKPFQPSVCGEIRSPLPPVTPSLAGAERVIMRRAALELQPGSVINLGFGMPPKVVEVIREAGLSDWVTFSVEQGALGGYPRFGSDFGIADNPEMIFDTADVLQFYNGGGLDLTMLGFGQLDAAGNVNVSHFSGIVSGCGGFIDITQGAKRILFLGTFTASGLAVNVAGGRVQIEREGRVSKIVPNVEQITFNGQYALSSGKQVRIITERGVLDLTPDGLMLTEVAPGVDIQEQILNQCLIPLLVSPHLKTYDPVVFEQGPLPLTARVNNR
jgi:propionate CoA-transferase